MFSALFNNYRAKAFVRNRQIHTYTLSHTHTTHPRQIQPTNKIHKEGETWLGNSILGWLLV